MKRLLMALALPFVAVAPQHALAQALEEIIVTATKREESVQDIPIAVTAIDSLTLERAGVKDLRDLSTVAASFNMNSSQTESQGSTLRIRGVGTTGNNIGLESAVGVFLDGVYLSRPGIALGDLLDVEAIEVLRGPQGTLFGRNTSAGALNIRTKKPSMQENEFFANATAGNYDAYNVQAGASGPIIADKLAYRLSGAWREQEGFLDSTTGAESRNRDRYMVRGQLLWQMSDTMDLRVIGDYADADENCCDAVILQDGGARGEGAGFEQAGLPPDGGAPAIGKDAFDDLKSNAEQFENPFEQKGLSAEWNWDLSDSTTLTFLGSWRDFDADSVQHSDFVGTDVFSVQSSAAEGWDTWDKVETWTAELRLAGEMERLSWMVGLYYSDEEIEENQGLGLGVDYSANTEATLWNTAFLPLLGLAEGLRDVPLATGGTFGDVLDAPSSTIAFAGGNDAAGSFAQNNFTQDSVSWSIFTHNTFRITDRLDLVVGARYIDEDKDGTFTQADASNDACFATAANMVALNAGAAGTGLEVVAGTIGAFSTGFACFPFATPADVVASLPTTFDDNWTDDEVAYTGKVVYAFTDVLTGYVSFTHGFKAGGFNLDSTAAAAGADPSFDSETNDAWEVGIKSEWFDNRLRANVAAWYYDLEDFQVLEFTGVQFKTFNVAKAESSGIELEFYASLLEGLDVNLAYTYVDSNYPNDCDDHIDPPDATSTLCGNDLTNSPDNVVTAGLSYQGYWQNFQYFFNSNYRWEDDRRTSTQPNLPQDWQQSNYKLNLRVGFGSESGTWTVELWGNNVTDEQTKNVTFNTPLRPGSRGTFLEAPRTYGVTLRTEF